MSNETLLTARLSEVLRRTHPRLLAETLAAFDAARSRPATDPSGLERVPGHVAIDVHGVEYTEWASIADAATYLVRLNKDQKNAE